MRTLLFVLAIFSAALPAAAQPPRAQITPATADAVAAGSSTRLALSVSLPPGLHVQADQPRDPSLIPTVLTVDAPAGVRVTHLIYPQPEDFTLEGEKVPLLVFDSQFVVGAAISVDASVAPGELKIPGRFRYQACDDKMCFQPRTERFEWTLRVVAPGTATPGSGSAAVFVRNMPSENHRPRSSALTIAPSTMVNSPLS